VTQDAASRRYRRNYNVRYAGCDSQSWSSGAIGSIEEIERGAVNDEETATKEPQGRHRERRVDAKRGQAV
jgi:hypothetical protein